MKAEAVAEDPSAVSPSVCRRARVCVCVVACKRAGVGAGIPGGGAHLCVCTDILSTGGPASWTRGCLLTC